jgi:ABC-type multidrug transport system fused ATPase/permease subunit
VYSQKLFDLLRDLHIRLVLVRSLSTSFFQPFAILFVIVLFAISYGTPGFSFIAFAASLYLIQKIFTYLESGQNAVNSIITLLPYARNLEDFGRMLEEHQEVIKEEGKEPFVFTRALQFKKVSLSYTRSVALRDVSFTLRRGETMGLIGPSGAGKTTVADLLLRLFEPTSGEILLDDKPLSVIGFNEWRKHVGYVAQDAFLLNDTIEENIRFYYPDLSKEDIVSAAKQANIYDFIMGLPEGFGTVVGDRGVMLSGGQRQRVVLALARRPEFLILDEATSALDSESERLIQESIRSLSGKVTVFIIAHRLSTIEHADTIMVLTEGRIAEIGSPATLRSNPESYFARHTIAA